MKTLIKNNIDFLSKKVIFNEHKKTIKKIVDVLNKDKLIIISGMKNVGKLNLIKELLGKLGGPENFFYFNKELDTDQIIQNNTDLSSLLQTYISTYKTPKIIILHNTNKIEGIKDFILKIYEQNYKIILIGNTVKISGKTELEILPKSLNSFKEINIQDILTYGTLDEVGFLKHPYFKEKYLNLIRNDIFLKDIFINFGVKSIDLYNCTMSFLAKNNLYFSLRELNKFLNDNLSISLKTNIDYIDFGIEAKILKRVYKYDVKSNKTISSQAKYYFTDIGIRNSLCNYNLAQSIQLENLVFNELHNKGYEVYGGLNGAFDFTFLGIIPAIVPFMKGKELKIYAHISEAKNSSELKKEIKKLLKISDKFKKYLIVYNIDKFELKKTHHDHVEVIGVIDFLRNVK